MDSDKSNSPSLVVSRLFALVSNMEREIAARVDLSPQLGRVLLFLLEAKPCCVRKLTELMNTHPTTTSKLLAKLEALKLITRSIDPVDRRLERVQLTVIGHEKAEKYRNLIREIMIAPRSGAEKHFSSQSSDESMLEYLIQWLQRSSEVLHA